MTKPRNVPYRYLGELDELQMANLATWFPDLNVEANELPNLRQLQHYVGEGPAEQFWHTMMLSRPTFVFETYRRRFSTAISLNPDERGTWAHYFVTYHDHGHVCNGAGHLNHGGHVVELINRSGTERINYYTWGKCAHEYEHKSGGNCYHIYTCKLCGNRHDVDSSD